MAKVANKAKPNPIARPFTKELLLLVATISVSKGDTLKRVSTSHIYVLRINNPYFEFGVRFKTGVLH